MTPTPHHPQLSLIVLADDVDDGRVIQWAHHHLGLTVDGTGTDNPAPGQTTPRHPEQGAA